MTADAARLRTEGKPRLHQVKQISQIKGKQQQQVGQVMKKVKLQTASSKCHEVVSPDGESPSMREGSTTCVNQVKR